METNCNEYTHNIEELLKVFTSSKKCNLIRFLFNNFKENVHYVCQKTAAITHGGQNKIKVMLTKDVYELIENSYNLKHQYVKRIQEAKFVNILMSLETQTIGYIAKIFEGSLTIKRQKMIGKYKVDLFISEYSLILECDENGHKDRDPTYERKRERFLLDQGHTIIRFNPNAPGFEHADVMQHVIKVILGKSIDKLILVWVQDAKMTLSNILFIRCDHCLGSPAYFISR